jgi:flagella basal body P-ring formation protein FlgA
MPVAQLLVAFAGATAAVGLVPAGEVALQDRQIRLGDVADLSGLAPELRRRLAPRVVAVLPLGRSRTTLAPEALAALVRRAVPGLDLRMPKGVTSFTFRLAQPPAAASAAQPCAALTRSLPSGAALSPDDIVPVACIAALPPRLRFDRLNGVVRADEDLASGAYLGRVSPARAAAVDAGDKLTLVASAGPVRVAREVVALQPGRAGGRVFVRDAEGNVTSAPLALQGDKK